MIELPKLRVDDVLQSRHFSEHQQIALSYRPFYDWFLMATEVFQDTYLKLSIVAEGIDVEKEWVEYIKSHKNWEVQVHCWEHKELHHTEYEQVKKELTMAKEKIEDTFHQKVTQFYPPRHKVSGHIFNACKELGLSVELDEYIPRWWLVYPNQIPEIYFHFWVQNHIDTVKKIYGK